jgi:hypothetical protein
MKTTQKKWLEVVKNAGKFMEVGNLIWNTFHNLHFFHIFKDFELFQ